MSKPKAVIIDLDGTFCDVTHRVHHVEKVPQDWDAFFNEAYRDPPVEWCQDLVRAMQAIGYINLFVTGRAEREISAEWICRHAQMTRRSVDEVLFTRDKGDFRKDHEIKEEIYRKLIEPHYRVVFAVDDKRSIVDLWRRLGVPALHCSDWDEKSAHNPQEVLDQMKKHQKA